MIIRHQFKGWLMIASVIILTISCKKALEKYPLDQFNTATFWTSEENAMLALSGVYRGNILMNNPEYSPTDWWSYNGLLWLEMATDNAYPRTGDNHAFNKLTNGTMTASLAILGNYWQASYAKIARSNDFLENVVKVPMAETKKKRIIAEVRFLRACQYFYLSQHFGSVPLVLKTLSKEEANSLTKAAKSTIVDFVVTELTEAANDLPRDKDIPARESGRASKQAALAFLGRIQLAENKFQEAAETYKTIIEFGDNIIDPDYSSIFLQANENSKEHIFSAQHVQDVAANSVIQHFGPDIIGAWGINCPLANLMEAYSFSDGSRFSYTDPRYDPNDLGKNRDPRLKYTILYNNALFKDKKYVSHPDSANVQSFTGYGVKKFVDESFSGNLRSYGGNISVIRYAEILLSYLEAKLEAGHPIDILLLDATINKVRSRASVNMPRVTETNPTVLRNILRNERRVELALEGIRYWDLLRWKIADQVLKADFYGHPFLNTIKPLKKKGNIVDPYRRWFVGTRNFRKGIDETWPIPQSEVEINPNLR